MNGFGWTENVLCHSKARGTAKLVLLGIASHMGPRGSWPGIDKLAYIANVHRRNVERAIDVLEDLGELVVEHREGGTNRYAIHVECPKDCVIHRGGASAGGRYGVSAVGGTALAPGEPNTEPNLHTSTGTVTYLDAGARVSDDEWRTFIEREAAVS